MNENYNNTMDNDLTLILPNQIDLPLYRFV
jgi:hypothetical protein